MKLVIAFCYVIATALLLALLGGAPATAADTLTIGYLQLKKDARYGNKRLFASYLTEALGRPYRGARVALAESRFHGAGHGVELKLDRVRGRDVAALLQAVDELAAAGVGFFILDLPAGAVAELSAALRERPLLLFNISAREDALRQQRCQPNLLHVIPNYAMETDALVQYLVFKKWARVLVLQGSSAQDQQIVDALQRSAKRYKASLVDVRPYVLSNDPRERDQNNVALLTGGADYDVIFVADADGEFARDVPYHTLKPALIVGSEGLAALGWHWAWERYGAPQLNNRFVDAAGRPMRSVDWAAWMAVKVVAEALQRSDAPDFASLREHILSQDAIFDGFKGSRLNFRPWDGQLRQPVLLATHNWVVERAPVKGFLHQSNDLDTLGFDVNETACQR